MHDELRANLFWIAIAKFDHFREFVARIDVQKREGNSPGVEGFLRQPQHHRGILPDGIEHHWAGKLRYRLAKDVNALRLQYLKMSELPFRHVESCFQSVPQRR